MIAEVYYVVRVYKDGTNRVDSGPHNSLVAALIQNRIDHQYNVDDYRVMRVLLDGELV